MSIQVSLRIRPDWHEALENLARQASVTHEENITIQTLIREALYMSYSRLAEYAKNKNMECGHYGISE